MKKRFKIVIHEKWGEYFWGVETKDKVYAEGSAPNAQIARKIASAVREILDVSNIPEVKY